MRPEWRDRFLELKQNEAPYFSRFAGLVAGVDEAGRGPLAGPVVAAAVILPPDFEVDHGLDKVDDSKRLSGAQRERLFAKISAKAVSFSWVAVSERIVDEAGILNATLAGMREAVETLSVRPSFVLVDGREIPSLGIAQSAIPRADGTFLSVACASVVAKHARDMLMADAHERFPQYGFDSHKGYGTREHIDALLRHGPCSLHRLSFRPVREVEFVRDARRGGRVR
ncbi:MAG: ribonuclease HII [Candidatus Eisenbacteria bacterium]